MSVKVMGLVWDIACPSKVNGMDFKPGHKYVLLAYADHADHAGRNIYPAVDTVAKKTGYEERSVQRLTHELDGMGMLAPDGVGPRGTNRWYIPLSEGGDKIAPLTKFQGDISSESLGDIPSGDIPSGDILTPDLKDPEPEQLIYITNNIDSVWGDTKEQISRQFKKALYNTWIEPTEADSFQGNTLRVRASNTVAVKWLDQNIKALAQQLLGTYVVFFVEGV
jgi:hypothetical protein